MKTVQDYLNEIGTEVLLTAEEETVLLPQAVNGDQKSIDKIICANRLLW